MSDPKVAFQKRVAALAAKKEQERENSDSYRAQKLKTDRATSSMFDQRFKSGRIWMFVIGMVLGLLIIGPFIPRLVVEANLDKVILKALRSKFVLMIMGGSLAAGWVRFGNSPKYIPGLAFLTGVIIAGLIVVTRQEEISAWEVSVGQQGLFIPEGGIVLDDFDLLEEGGMNEMEAPGFFDLGADETGFGSD